MNRSAAMAESVVFNDLIDLTGGRDEIPVPVVSGGVLSKFIQFCEKKRDFHKLFESLVGRYIGWVTGFVNANHTILSDLHQAGDFLNISSLLDLTSSALGNMVGKPVEEISGWYGKLSLSRMLSSLGIGNDDDARHHGVTSGAS